LPPPRLAEESEDGSRTNRWKPIVDWGSTGASDEDAGRCRRDAAAKDGWGIKRIARELGCSHHTVKAYVAADGVKPFKTPGQLIAHRHVSHAFLDISMRIQGASGL
jgi:AraC-like DNA-binding protein